MFTWLKNLFNRDPEALQAQKRRKKKRQASKRVRARERELRRQLQGSTRNAPFCWGRPGQGMPPPLGA